MRTGLKMRVVGMLAATGVIAAAGFGLTASNTVTGANAGAGQGTISGYTVNNVAYVLDSTTPDKFSQVKFRVEGVDVSSTTAFAIHAKLDTSWSANCDTRTYSGATTPTYTAVTCSYSGTLPAVESATTLRAVIAAK